MENIQINLSSSPDIYRSPDDLFEWLKHGKANTKRFRDKMISFLNNFNEQYGADLSFEQVLGIYEWTISFDMNSRTILCKALLDFVQSNWIIISFRSKCFEIRFETLAKIEGKILMLWEASLGEIEQIILLSRAISSFISKIRKYFNVIIWEWVSLHEANIDNGFNELLWSWCDLTWWKLNWWEDLAHSSVVIYDWFVISCDCTDLEFATKLKTLKREELNAVLGFIYQRLPNSMISGKKHIDIAKALFWNNYESSLWQTILRVLEEWGTIRAATIKKIDFSKLRKYLLSPSMYRKAIEAEELELWNRWLKVNQLKETEAILSWHTLLISEWIEINLESDELFTESLINLSPDVAQVFFNYLVILVQKVFDIPTRNAKVKLASLIQQDESNTSNIYQKLVNLSNKPSKVTEKFLRNNINISAFRSFLLDTVNPWSKEQNKDLWAEDGDVWEIDLALPEAEDEPIKPLSKVVLRSFDFEFGVWDETICLSIKSNWKRTLEWFLFSLNSFISSECVRQWYVGLIDEYTIDDFNGIELDTDFFCKIERNWNNRQNEMFTIIDQIFLSEFLNTWCKVVWFKLKKPKAPYLEPGSEDELWYFVFNVWQKRLNKFVQTEVRKSRRRSANISSRMKIATLNKDMFKWTKTLTLDLLDRIWTKQFEQIFSKMPRKEVEELISNFLSWRQK